eukprot:jgi/Psemu1/197130/e_gw1.198.18.1
MHDETYSESNTEVGNGHDIGEIGKLDISNDVTGSEKDSRPVESIPIEQSVGGKPEVAVDDERLENDTRADDSTSIQRNETNNNPISTSGEMNDEATNGHVHNFDEESALDNCDKDDDHDNDDETATTYVDDMSLFHYARIEGAGLPQGMRNRSLNDTGMPKSTCSELTVIQVDPENLVASSNNAIAEVSTNSDFASIGRSASWGNEDSNSVATATSGSSTAVAAKNHRREQTLLLSSDLWRQPHLIMACGYRDSSSTSSSRTSEGKITFTRVQHSTDKSPNPAPSVVFATVSTDIGVSGMISTQNEYSNVSMELYVRERENNAYRTAHGTSIVDMSFDSSGSILGAIDEGGHCAIWEFNNSRHGSTLPRPATNVPNGTQPATLVPTLTAEISQQSRVNYPQKWGPPSCMVVDPAYKRKREKSVVVGFADGQLYLTKRGSFFQRRNDIILYQAPHTADRNRKKNGDSYRGIETIVWRGPLLAWADVAGIKLMDMDHLTRIAQIDRPAGASSFLYPTIRDLEPSLFFETAQHLLVGWGDCLMQIYVEEHEDEASAISISTGGSDGTSKVRKRRTVACEMAWELECVACDVVPLDKDNVAVLGLVSLTDDEDMPHQQYDLEMQILSRKDGSIFYSASLPLINGSEPQISSHQLQSGISVRNFRLLSTFALPRMEEDEETKALRDLEGADTVGYREMGFDMNQPLFASTESSSNKKIGFRDPHLQWNIKSIMYEDDGDNETDHFGSSENSSVDSDDYECILRPIETVQPLPLRTLENTDRYAPPPTMVVCTESDAILSLTSTIDDAIENSLDNRKFAQALSRGLRHKRELRRYDLDDLINRYLKALLRIPQGDDADEENMLSSSLSMRRMQLAVKAMPVLFGDRIKLWEYWTKELEKIPGSLFYLKNYLPVRDPILPSKMFFRILQRMLVEVEQLSRSAKKDNPASIDVFMEASDHFLESLLAWGPTKVLKDFISFYKYNRKWRDGKALDKYIRATEISLQRRYLQTASSYLIFPIRDIEEELEVSAPRYEVHNVDTEDSLFNVSSVISLLAPRVPLVASSDNYGEGGLRHVQTSYISSQNDYSCLEAMARLRMMQGEYDLALKCFLAIGACHAKDPLQSFEKTAVEVVNGTGATHASPPSQISNQTYEFVISLIENHLLNQYLFEKDFLLSTGSILFMPMYALIRLVGLQRVGTFLMDHCVAAGFTYNTTLEELNDSIDSSELIEEPKAILRRGSLPIDKVADQLESSPAILHWYLHLVFTRKPDFYVNFPTNSIPCKAITDLHRKHFQLHIDFAGEMKDSSKVLTGMEAYKVESATTPLLTFLKAVLPLGGIGPVEARRVLEIERSKDAVNMNGTKDDSKEFSSAVFALELGYIIEMYSEQTETEALGILNLYLKGAQSLPLSVSYAQRQKQFASVLWDRLISHCLEKASDGAMFGELLGSAALFGADLARLVARIPPGMVVEGLRPRLVAAVADYRMKLEIYEAAIGAGSEEEVALMREIGHRARRGVRYDLEKNRHKSFAELIREKNAEDEKTLRETTIGKNNNDEATATQQKISKTKLRRNHKRLVYSIQRR